MGLRYGPLTFDKRITDATSGFYECNLIGHVDDGDARLQGFRTPREMLDENFFRNFLMEVSAAGQEWGDDSQLHSSGDTMIDGFRTLLRWGPVKQE